MVLPASAQVRLRRLAPGATFREELHQLVVPLDPKAPAAEVLCTLLDALAPARDGARRGRFRCRPTAPGNMPRRMTRVIVLLVVVAAGLAVASFSVTTTAATVNGSSISQSALDSDLSAIAGSTSYQCYLAVQHELSSPSGTPSILPVAGVGDPEDSTQPATYNTGFVRFWLSQMMENEVVAQQVAAHGLTVTSADRSAGAATLTLQIQGALSTYEQETGSPACAESPADVLTTLPSSFVDEQAQVQANQDALLAWAAGYSLSDEGLQRFYASDPGQFDTVCLSAIEETTATAAQEAESKAQAGTPFDQLGKATSAGCEIASSLPSTLSGLKAGQIGPVLSQGNDTYVLAQATSRTPTSFAKAHSQVRDALLVKGETRTSTLLRVATGRKDATADPRYGRVLPGTILLALPKSPPAHSMLSPLANTTPQRSASSASASTTG